MNYREAILKRISRRTYLGTNISEEKVALLKEKIREANAESGLTIDWVENGERAFAGGKSYGMFKGVKSLIVLKGNSNLANLREKVGYYGEKLILEATILGLGTCWVGGTFAKEELKVLEEEELVCVIPVGNVNEDKSLKEKIIRSVIHRKTKSIEQLLVSDQDTTKEIKEAMELVQRAPTTKNMQKATFKLERGIITAHVPEDYHLDLVDLGICKLHFECGMKGNFEVGNGGKFIKK